MAFNMIQLLLLIGNYFILILIALKDYRHTIKNKPNFDFYYMTYFIFWAASVAIPILMSVELGGNRMHPLYGVFILIFLIIIFWAYFRNMKKTLTLLLILYFMSFFQQIAWAFFSPNPSKYLSLLSIWYTIGLVVILYGGPLIQKLLLTSLPILRNLRIQEYKQTTIDGRVIAYSLWMSTYVLLMLF